MVWTILDVVKGGGGQSKPGEVMTGGWCPGPRMHPIPCFCLHTSRDGDLPSSQSHLPHLHSKTTVLFTQPYLFVCLFLTAQVTGDHTRVQGY